MERHIGESEYPIERSMTERRAGGGVMMFLRDLASVTNCLTGLQWYAESIRAGLESKLSALITHMTWSGKQRRLYMVLTLPVMLFSAAQVYVSSVLVNQAMAGGGGGGGVLVAQAFWALHSALPLSTLMIAFGIAIGMRRFLQSEAYQSELRVTPNSRRELFQAAMAGYFPFLMFLYFVAIPTAWWAAGYAVPNRTWMFSEVFFGVDEGRMLAESDMVVLALGVFMRLLDYFGFLFGILLRLFLVVRARTLQGGMLSAIVIGAIVSFLISMCSNIPLMILYRAFRYDSPILEWSTLLTTLAYRLPAIAFLGLVWYVAQRRFESGPLAVEEGFE